MPGLLTLDALKTLVTKGEIDTVIVAFADAQGRLVGKRVSARLFQISRRPSPSPSCARRK